MAHPKWYKEEDWNDIQLRIDEQKFTILKELKGANHVPKFSLEDLEFLKRFVDFYLEDSDNSYIKFYDADVVPLKIPCYLSNIMVLLEFLRQEFYFQDNFTKENKKATIKMPITCGYYSCNNQLEDETIKSKIVGYGFEYHALKIQYESYGCS